MDSRQLFISVALLGFSAILVFVPTAETKASISPNKEFAGIASDILNPDRLFEALKSNITVPIAPLSGQDQGAGSEIKLPVPAEALKEASPKLREVNRDVREETGIDFAKLIGWFAKVLRVFFLTVVEVLEKVSQAMQN